LVGSKHKFAIKIRDKKMKGFQGLTKTKTLNKRCFLVQKVIKQGVSWYKKSFNKAFLVTKGHQTKGILG